MVNIHNLIKKHWNFQFTLLFIFVYIYFHNQVRPRLTVPKTINNAMSQGKYLNVFMTSLMQFCIVQRLEDSEYYQRRLRGGSQSKNREFIHLQVSVLFRFLLNTKTDNSLAPRTVWKQMNTLELFDISYIPFIADLKAGLD